MYKLTSDGKQPELVRCLAKDVVGCMCVHVIFSTWPYVNSNSTARRARFGAFASTVCLQRFMYCCIGCMQVLKMAKPVPGLRRAFQREWMLGRRLNAVAAAASELNMIIHTGEHHCVIYAHRWFCRKVGDGCWGGG